MVDCLIVGLVLCACVRACMRACVRVCEYGRTDGRMD